MNELFDGRLDAYEVREEIVDRTTATDRVLTDGNNYLWILGRGGNVDVLVRYGRNAPGKILGAIAEVFDTDIYSEHEPQYWGHDTEEAWDLAWKNLAEEDQRRFHADIVRYVAGESNGIKPGTVGAVQAEIAKGLVGADPGLVASERRTELMAAIEKTYSDRHAVVVELTDEDRALARLIATHEDDLPFV